MKKFKILILDEDNQYTEKISGILTDHNFSTFTAQTYTQAMDILKSISIDFLIFDIFLPKLKGLQFLAEIKQGFPGVEVIMISSRGSLDNVVQATRLGAVDYIKKPANQAELFKAINRNELHIKEHSQLLTKNDNDSLLSEELKNKIGRDFIGHSKAMYKVRSMAILAAKEKDVNVLITGENGTGKEIVAQIIHYGSQRGDNNFCPVNSAAIPESLLESEFFGHKKGSYTGAIEDKKGCFELADKGTLFLDEISEMPYVLQAKLLRAIEEKKIKPIGCDNEIRVDFRIISATNCNIEELTNGKKMRIDLFYRLNTFIINIPPLRSRPEDIEPLVNYFIENIALSKNAEKPEIHPEAFSALKKYHYPGNIRELQHMVERAFLVSNGKQIKMKDFQLQKYVTITK